MSRTKQIIKPDHNCWRTGQANKLSLIIDAKAYFVAVKEAMLQAQHSAYLIGWDFDTRIEFEPEGKTLEGPNKLGDFLKWVVKENPDLNVYLLKWDLGFLKSLGRGTMPLVVADLLTNDRIHMKLDGAHPKGSTHHQKIIVIDDCLAFCGGIDMTVGRWDTPDHKDKNRYRKEPNGHPYEPWHDASTVLSGDVVCSLGDLARDRWYKATNKKISPPTANHSLWPKSIKPMFKDIPVGIARTIPQYRNTKEIKEIEALYLDIIKHAKKTIYCESQYFASRKIAEAIAKRLKEKNGPEIIIINPQSADGFLESAAMDTARAHMISMVKKADSHNRFRIYTPVTKKHAPIYVHAKILIADDNILRVGSSNLNNRSMGFDTECDLVIEAKPHQENSKQLREKILHIRHTLLAEHLGTTTATITRTLKKSDGSLIHTIEALISKGKSLKPYKPHKPALYEEPLGENDFLDPEEPVSFRKRLRQLILLQKSPLR